MAIFQRLNQGSGMTVIVVTHEPDIAEYAHRNIHFRDGRLQRDVAVPARALRPKNWKTCRRRKTRK